MSVQAWQDTSLFGCRPFDNTNYALFMVQVLFRAEHVHLKYGIKIQYSVRVPVI